MLQQEVRRSPASTERKRRAEMIRQLTKQLEIQADLIESGASPHRQSEPIAGNDLDETVQDILTHLEDSKLNYEPAGPKQKISAQPSFASYQDGSSKFGAVAQDKMLA